jgi:hypothetical protein
LPQYYLIREWRDVGEEVRFVKIVTLKIKKHQNLICFQAGKQNLLSLENY